MGNINLASARYLGTLDMLSIPPDTTISLTPNWILCAASIVAAITSIKRTMILHFSVSFGERGKDAVSDDRVAPFIPDAQTLLMVVQTTELGIPAPNAACLAGACPKFALRTFPKKTS